MLLKSSRLAEYTVLALAICGFSAVFALTPQTKHVQTDAEKTKSAHTSTVVKRASPTKSATTTPPSTPAETTPAPASQPVTHTSAPAGVRTSNKVEPIVTPSPSSSVSGLAPTAPSSTSTPSSSSPSPSSPSGSSTPSSQTTTSYTSTNWSGYLASNGNYTQISGSWTATSPSGNGTSTSADATWIGIGGVTSADLIQVGTDNIVSASGQVSSAAFYELLPGASINISSLNISPGDQMVATISEVSSSLWDISITDSTKSQTFSLQVSYNSSNSSAEWVEEDPSYSNGQLVPFDNFHTAMFTNSTTVSNGNTLNLNTSNALPITLVDQNGQPIATPSSINADGASFSVTHS